MTRVAEQIAAMPLGGLLLTWSTFEAIRDGRVRRMAAQLGAGALLAKRDGRIVLLGNLAARPELRQQVRP